jgi:hypothetical protein
MPKRSATLTWDVIIGIIVPDVNDPASEELRGIAGVAASIIAAEAPKDDPIIIFGGGPRLRIYCLYNDDAVLDDKINEDPVRQSVTGNGWCLSLPCETDDFEWIQRKLKSLSSRVVLRRLGDPSPESNVKGQFSKIIDSTETQINLEEFFKS